MLIIIGHKLINFLPFKNKGRNLTFIWDSKFMAINGKGIKLVDLFVWKWTYSNAEYLHATRVFSSHLTFSPVLQILKVSCRRHTHWRVSSLKFIIPVYRCRDRFFARWKFCRHREPPSVSLSFSWRNFRAKTILYFFFPIAANISAF